MINCGDRVKVINLEQEKAINLWGGYDDLTCFLNAEGTVTSIIDGVRYGIEFDDDFAYITRKRTGFIFREQDLELQ